MIAPPVTSLHSGVDLGLATISVSLSQSHIDPDGSFSTSCLRGQSDLPVSTRSIFHLVHIDSIQLLSSFFFSLSLSLSVFCLLVCFFPFTLSYREAICICGIHSTLGVRNLLGITY
ncbi:hypothetical protein BDV28DRAFT_19610 [Aspergillus coremiiformis]|uniref:Uncharacterized protein n=1 Tax=Aspergillus coremiiformis TaxID=138285 RepID=A0A5N6Z3D3_9EURO|nr:hypothetical protein BDV28DRAFT_19610 [Aspergillus coremiiformis]